MKFTMLDIKMQKIDIKKYPYYKDYVKLCENYADFYIAFSISQHRYMSPLQMDVESLDYLSENRKELLSKYGNSYSSWRDYDWHITYNDITNRVLWVRLDETYKGYVYIQ